MKNIRIGFAIPTLLALGILSSPAHAAHHPRDTWNGRVTDAATGQTLSQDEFHARLAKKSFIILGEKHNTPAVQNAQAAIIRSVVQAQDRLANFAVNWEFLNFTTQALTAAAFERFKKGEIDGLAFLKETQGNATNSSYVPILEATRDFAGELHGVNISREDKAPVVEHGISAADPKLVPPGYAIGDANYYERFATAMAGHATAEQMANYFDAQCLTDDVIAFHAVNDNSAPLRFLVEGEFHTDYFGGTVARLRARGLKNEVVVRFIDASDFTNDADLSAAIKDPKYGPVADYVYYVNEPSAAPAPAPAPRPESRETSRYPTDF